MRTVRLKIIVSPTMTADEAMRKFAAEHWDEPRRLGTIHPSEFQENGFAFQMENGHAWYVADPTGGGWIISLVIPGDEPTSQMTF